MNEERLGLIFKRRKGLLIPYRLLKKGMKNDGRDARAMAVFFVFGSAREKFQQNMSGEAGAGNGLLLGRIIL